jgi:hypothetical protein
MSHNRIGSDRAIPCLISAICPWMRLFLRASGDSPTDSLRYQLAKASLSRPDCCIASPHGTFILCPKQRYSKKIIPDQTCAPGTEAYLVRLKKLATSLPLRRFRCKILRHLHRAHDTRPAEQPIKAHVMGICDLAQPVEIKSAGA